MFRSTSPTTKRLSILLLISLWLQVITPPAMAAPRGPSPIVSTISNAPRQLMAKLAVVEQSLVSLLRAALAPQENFNIVLTPATTEFKDYSGLDYHASSRKLLLSANTPSGQPNNFEAVAADGSRTAFSNVAGLSGDVVIATARDEGQALSRGGFPAGELFTSTGVPGVVARVNASGATVQNPWVTLPNETGAISGLYFDRTGVFGGDLLAVTTTGGVWRVNAAAAATKVAGLDTRLAGVASLPDDPDRYGPWSGKILTGAKDQSLVYAIDAQGQSSSVTVNVQPQDIDVVPAQENFFAVDSVGQKVWGASDGAFAGIIGDILVTQQAPGVITRLRWNGVEFVASQLASATEFKQVAFAPAGINPINPVKQLYDKIAVVRHSATLLNSGRVEGSLWQLLPEAVTLDGTDTITTDLLVPGTPVVLHSQPATYAGTLVGSENPEPSNYTITIKGSSLLRHVVARTNPIELENVAAPPAPAGTRDVSISNSSGQLGDPSTLRNLTITGNVGTVAVPPGTYGHFSVAGRNVLVFGVQNSETPTVYNLEELTLTASSELRLAGPIVLTVKNRVTLTGSTLGAADNPKRLLLKIATGLSDPEDALKVSGSAVLYGIVRAPQGTITIEGTGRVRGTVACNYLFVNGNGVLQITESDIPPPPVNRPPMVDAGGDQSITLPTNSVSLNGIASDDGLPQGSVLQLAWSVVSGPGAVVFSDAAKATSTATFTTAGDYVLKLTASDGQLSASDTLKVTVVPNNQPPTVNAGPDQIIELPDPAFLKGVITDDGMPQGSTVTSTWSVVGGPGPVVFGNVNAPVTTASFTNPGLYTLRLTATDTEFTVSDEMQVTVLLNQPPTANAGPDQVITLPGTSQLNGSATDDGLPRGSTLETFWSFVSGPGSVIFPDATLLNAVAIFTVPGTYVLRLTASDGKLSASDELTIVVNPKPFAERTYTLDADFDQGNSFNLIHDVANQLQLDHTAREFDFLWVAVSSKGTIVKINTQTGQVIGEYFTSPSGQPKDPSRTTVDLNGNVWATNRAGNSVVHVGLVENGQCVDRNGNGLIETSTGFGDIKAWTNTGGANTNGGVSTAADECIIHYTKVNSFGTRHVSVNKDNDIWVSGTSGRRFDLLDGVTGQIKRAEPTVGFGGYGGLIDRAGVIWSSNPMLRWDTAKPLTGANGSNWTGFNHPSYGLCLDSGGNVWNTSFGNNQIRKFAPNGTLLGTFAQGDAFAQGCVVDKNDHVWVAHSLNRSTVGHLKNDGTYVGTITVQSGPTGVAVDGSGKIWATNHNSGTVSRINPNAGPLGPDGVTRVGAVDFTTINLGGNLYNYSDMTGSTLSGIPGSGTWSTVFDSQIAGAEWGRIGWTAKMCGDASLTVSVASSTNGTTFGPAQVVTNGTDPTVANGRFLRIIVNFKRSSSGESPILYDLSVGTSGFELPVVANEPPTAFAGGDQTVTLPDPAKLSGNACDDGFPRGQALALSWSKVSGPGDVAFAKPASPVTDASFTVAGTYVLKLTASDSEHSASDEVMVTVLPANAAPIVNAGPNQTITLPNTANLNGTVADDGFPTGATVSTFWSQVSGPGLVTFNEINNPVTRAIFSTPGTYVLRLSANDTHRIGTDDIQVTVNASPALVGATLQLAPVAPGPYVTGTLQSVRATLRNSAGTPLANFGVEFTVAGPNATAGSAVTNTSGIATFSYAGTNPGTDTVTALVRSTATANVNGTPPVSMVWTLTPQSPPVTQGWIGGPLEGASVTGTVPVTVGAGLTLTGVKVEYWPATNPAGVTTLLENGQGGSGATLATIDTTTLANGNYVIRVTATDQNGNEQVSQVTITVTGENKPGRVTLTVRDLTVPLTGLPITIDRQYDSLERNQAGDFGFGWSLEVAGPRLEVNPDKDVTLTEPGTGRRVTFRFNPTSFGFPFSFFYQPTYLAEPGVFGKLSSNGCNLLIRSGTSGFACFLSTDLNYNPTAYAYTDPYGRVYTMTSAGKMLSIKNLDGNVLTFGQNGITSTAGNLTVPFVRDAQGRIEQITDPNGKVYRYNYDAAGDLVSVKTPDSDVPLTYEYYPGHFFKKGTDARGNPEATNTYFPSGRLESTTDAMGKTTTYSYDLVNNITTVTHPDNTGTTVRRLDANGSLLSETDPLNRTTNFTYDGNRQKLTETDALQKTTSFSYDANGHLKSITDPLNKTVSFVNNANGLITTATDQNNKVRTFTYDASSNFTGITDELGNSFSIAYNDKGNPLTLTDGNGKTTRFAYDAFGHIIAKTDPLGRTTAYTYDGMGRVLTMTDARGISHFTYDDLGNVLSVKDPLNNETRYEYDANGNRTAVIDARQNRTSYEYDAANRLIKVTYPDNTTMQYTYNFRGQKETQTDQANRITRYFYDNAGQLVKTIHPDQKEINIAYDEVGRVKTVTNELNRTTTYEYDPNCGCRERLIKITDADGKSTHFQYDAKGRRISFRDANNNETRYEFNARDQLTKTIFPDNSFATTTYDAHGRVLTETDQEGKVTRFGYDDIGNLTAVTNAKNQTTLHAYDALNNLVSTSDALGRSTQYEYDALNRMIKRVLPLGMAELYTYDQVGNLATTLDFRGKQTSYEHDGLNRLIATRPDASLSEPAITFTYTPTGRRDKMIDSSGTTTYTYDARDRRLTKQAPQGTLTYGYDDANNLASVHSSHAEGIAVSYAYDTVNRLEKVIDQRLGTTTYTYDPAGNLKSESRPNGVRSDYTYNLINYLTNVTAAKSGATQASFTYTLDKTGRRLSEVSHSGRAVNYTYDEIYRLTREAVTGDAANNGSVDYTHDSVGNRLSRISSLGGVLSATSTYDANDRLTSSSYDANGNTRTAEGKSFTYDFQNKIKSVNNGAVRLTYDGDGNLVGRTAGGITTQYLVDDLNPTGYSQIVEELVDGVVQRQYTYGNSIISQRQNIGGNWMASFYSTDGHGSVRQLTNDAGVVTDTYEYDAFGKLISSSGTTPNVYLYAGERFDADLGLYHLRARHYNPNQGRFMSMDPFKGRINEPISLHKYLYANADPVNMLDPSGFTSFSEYALKVKLIILRVVSALIRLARAIICIFLRAASFLAALVGLSHWAKVFQLAADYGLKGCPCVPEYEGFLYRGGSRTPQNMTPRPGIDTDGLSTFNSPDKFNPGDKVQVIDTSKLKNLFGRPDPAPPGHVTITPRDPSQMGPWADSRGGPIHPLTQEILDALVDEIRIGKCK
ncbi:MAG TPA: RHS repeat-associated core domain-containing protein [Pyrinomonadaceae bacterium]|nr:RHS repeat-associated core domain-containing protein [Pyrinomonadaceae bacterium]